MSNLSDLLVIGDSIALGAAEVRGSEIVEFIQPSCIDLLKAALPGVAITIDAEVRRNSVSVREEIDQIIQRHRPRNVMLMIGGSDADMDWKRFIVSDGKVARNRVPVERYEKNMRLICQKLMESGATVILTDVPNHDLTVCGPYVGKLSGKDVPAMILNGGGQAESDRHMVPYRMAVAAIARELDLQLIRYGEALDGHPSAEMVSVDGTHPSKAAHGVIAEVMIGALSRVGAAAELSA